MTPLRKVNMTLSPVSGPREMHWPNRPATIWASDNSPSRQDSTTDARRKDGEHHNVARRCTIACVLVYPIDDDVALPNQVTQAGMAGLGGPA